MPTSNKLNYITLYVKDIFRSVLVLKKQKKVSFPLA